MEFFVVQVEKQHVFVALREAEDNYVESDLGKTIVYESNITYSQNQSPFDFQCLGLIVSPQYGQLENGVTGMEMCWCILRSYTSIEVIVPGP